MADKCGHDDDQATPCVIDGVDKVDELLVDEFGGNDVLDDFDGGSTTDKFRWLRVEQGPDACLESVCSQQDVLRKIEEARSYQEQYGRADLYSREWEKAKDAKVGINGDSGLVFSVAQFNMLAEGLSVGPNAKTPFRVDPDDCVGESDEKFVYGGFTAIPHPSIVLEFSLRRWRLIEVLVGSDASAPYDLIATEELDRYFGFFAPVMGLLGYKSVFVPKVRSPGVRLGWYSDGCALFWKDKVFELVTEEHRQYSVGTQVFVVAVLRHRLSGRCLVVGATHLKAQRGGSAETEKIRCQQVDELVAYVHRVASGLVAGGVSIDTVPTIIMGDFNADPRFCKDPQECSIQRVLAVGANDDEPSAYKFRSSYQLDGADNAFYTTWKTRGQETKRRIIDYIFYRGILHCKATLRVPPEHELEATKLPGLRYPSDHLLIAAKFSIK